MALLFDTNLSNHFAYRYYETMSMIIQSISLDSLANQSPVAAAICFWTLELDHSSPSMTHTHREKEMVQWGQISEKEREERYLLLDMIGIDSLVQTSLESSLFLVSFSGIPHSPSLPP